MSRIAALIVAAALPAVANAAITGTTGMAVNIGPAPASCVFGNMTPGVVWAWDEQQNRGVSGLPVDLSINPSNSGSPTPGAVSGMIDSHFLHFNDFNPPQAVGTVTFNNPIIGVAYNNNFLDLSDAAVGNFGTVYPTGDPWRGINSITPGTSFVSILGNTISFNFNVIAGVPDFDQVRVFTAVPTPGSIAMLGAGGLMAARRRRR